MPIHLYCRSHSGAADVAVANLQTAHDALGNLNIYITSVTDLKNGLQDFVDNVGTAPIDGAQSAISVMTTQLSGLSQDLTGISSDLDDFSATYEERSPCLGALVDKMISINTTLLR